MRQIKRNREAIPLMGRWRRSGQCPRSAHLPSKPRRLRRCDQEVRNRTLATPHKVCEEVSNKEMRNHFEPRDVRVSLPRRADESSEVRSSGNNVPASASLDVEADEGRPVRLNGSEGSLSNLVSGTWPKRLIGHHQNGTWAGSPQRRGGDDIQDAHRGTDSNRAGHSLLHRQLGKPYVPHESGIPTVRKGDGTEGMR